MADHLHDKPLDRSQIDKNKILFADWVFQHLMIVETLGKQGYQFVIDDVSMEDMLQKAADAGYQEAAEALVKYKERGLERTKNE